MKNNILAFVLLALSAVGGGALARHIYTELDTKASRPDPYTAKALEALSAGVTALQTRGISSPLIMRESFPRIDTATRGGSGIVIQCGQPDSAGLASGVVLTAAHVVEDDIHRGVDAGAGLQLFDNPTGVLVKSNSYSLPVSSILLNKIDDIALLRVTFPHPVRAIPLAGKDAALGELVWTVSWPVTPFKGGGETQLFTITLGVRSEANRYTAAIMPGSSGGAVLNQQGELLGVLTGVYCLTNEQLGLTLPIPHMGVGLTLDRLTTLLTRNAASRPTTR